MWLNHTTSAFQCGNTNHMILFLVHPFILACSPDSSIFTHIQIWFGEMTKFHLRSMSHAQRLKLKAQITMNDHARCLERVEVFVWRCVLLVHPWHITDTARWLFTGEQCIRQNPPNPSSHIGSTTRALECWCRNWFGRRTRGGATDSGDHSWKLGTFIHVA